MPRYTDLSKSLGNFFEQAAEKTQQATDDLKDTIQRKTGRGIRNGNSFDTGIEGENSTRYQQIKTAIIEGKIKPTIRAVIVKYKCSPDTAKSYFRQLILEGILRQDEKTKRYNCVREG